MSMTFTPSLPPCTGLLNWAASQFILPNHGYVKNVLLALSGGIDDYFMPLRMRGNIKFWSIATLKQLLLRVVFRCLEYIRACRDCEDRDVESKSTR